MMYDGMIQGEYKELTQDQKITMKWRMKDWGDDDWSDVVLTFSDAGDNSCEVQVQQDNIPEYDRYSKFVHLDNLEGGWR